MTTETKSDWCQKPGHPHWAHECVIWEQNQTRYPDEAEDNTLKFDWHESDETFYRWLLPELMSDVANLKNETFKAISAASDHFTDVEITVQVNGIEVNAQRFFDSLDQRMDAAIMHEARKMLTQDNKFMELEDAVEDFTRAIKSEARRIARDRGIDLGEDSW